MGVKRDGLSGPLPAPTRQVAGLEGSPASSELQQAAPAGEGRVPQVQEPGPQVVKGQRHRLGSATAQSQHQQQQDAHGQPKEQGAASGLQPAGRWGGGGGGPDEPLPAGLAPQWGPYGAPSSLQDWWGGCRQSTLHPKCGLPWRGDPWGVSHGSHGQWDTPSLPGPLPVLGGSRRASRRLCPSTLPGGKGTGE